MLHSRYNRNCEREGKARLSNWIRGIPAEIRTREMFDKIERHSKGIGTSRNPIISKSFEVMFAFSTLKCFWHVLELRNAVSSFFEIFKVVCGCGNSIASMWEKVLRCMVGVSPPNNLQWKFSLTSRFSSLVVMPTPRRPWSRLGILQALFWNSRLPLFSTSFLLDDETKFHSLCFTLFLLSPRKSW